MGVKMSHQFNPPFSFQKIRRPLAAYHREFRRGNRLLDSHAFSRSGIVNRVSLSLSLAVDDGQDKAASTHAEFCTRNDNAPHDSWDRNHKN